MVEALGAEGGMVVALALPSGQSVIVRFQTGYAGPPARDDTLRLPERPLQPRAT